MARPKKITIPSGSTDTHVLAGSVVQELLGIIADNGAPLTPSLIVAVARAVERMVPTTENNGNTTTITTNEVASNV